MENPHGTNIVNPILSRAQKLKASYRTIADRLHLGPRLDDPKTCCGVLYCTFANGDHCWEATGEVQRIYNCSLSSRINEILEDTEDFWAQSARCRVFFCHSVYMVGGEKEKSNPVIFFCCENGSLRMKARDIIKANLNMSEYPAFRLGHTPLPPEFTARPRFATGTGMQGRQPPQEAVRLRNNLGGPVPHEVFLRSPTDVLCGVQVIIDGDRQGGHWIEATVGGVIALNGRVFGLTAAHGLLDDFRVLDKEDEEEDDQITEYDLVEDRGSLKITTEKHSLNQQDPKYQGSFILTSREAKSPHDAITKREKGKGVQQHQNLRLGKIWQTSIEKNSLGLDWALIEIDNDRFQAVIQFSVEKSTYFDIDHSEALISSQDSRYHLLQVKGIVQKLLPRPFVLAVTGRGAPLAGTTSGTIVSMRLPGATKMCEIWNVQFNGMIEQGDCGSFVVDPNSGNLYGHIVAGNIGSGFVYIMPACKTQLNIIQRFSSMFTLPTTDEYKQFFRSSLESSYRDYSSRIGLDTTSITAVISDSSSDDDLIELGEPKARLALSEARLQWFLSDPTSAVPYSSLHQYVRTVPAEERRTAQFSRDFDADLDRILRPDVQPSERS